MYAPNSYGGPQADPARAAEVRWHADGQMIRAAYTLHAEDDDWGQAGATVREVLDDAARERLAHNIIGHVSKGVKEPVLSRVFELLAQRRRRSRQEGRRVESAPTWASSCRTSGCRGDFVASGATTRRSLQSSHPGMIGTHDH